MARDTKSNMQMRKAVADACKADDVSSMSQIINAATDPASITIPQETLTTALESAVKFNAVKILSYVLDKGADAKTAGAALTLTWGDYSLPSRATLETLVAYGWDIDSYGHTASSGPLLWVALRDAELVDWCLAHNASVSLPDSTGHKPRPILERAAAIGNVTTFEALRTRGAPLSSRILPSAVRSANDSAPRFGESPSEAYEMHLNMVRHLIDKIGINANAPSYWAGSTCSTPLCCIACYPTGDTTQLIQLLLEKGGDPYLAGPSSDEVGIPSAFEAAVERNNTMFIRAVETWQLQNKDKTP